MQLRGNKLLLAMELTLPFLGCLILLYFMEYELVKDKPVWLGMLAYVAAGVTISIPTYRYMISILIIEKEDGTREKLRLLGVSNLQYLFSFFISEGIYMGLATFEMALLLTIIQFCRSQEFFTVWFTLMLFCGCQFGIALIVSAFFN